MAHWLGFCLRRLCASEALKRRKPPAPPGFSILTLCFKRLRVTQSHSLPGSDLSCRPCSLLDVLNVATGWIIRGPCCQVLAKMKRVLANRLDPKIPDNAGTYIQYRQRPDNKGFKACSMATQECIYIPVNQILCRETKTAPSRPTLPSV